MPFRMADYRLRVYRKFPEKRMVQVVIYLRETNSPLVYETTFQAGELNHRFQVIRIWEVPASVLLGSTGLFPYAVLGRVEGRTEEARSIITRLLTKRFGTLLIELKAKINALSIERIESLGEDLLDFTTINDLLDWFNAV